MSDPPNQPEPDDPPLTEAEAALLRRAATMPVGELDDMERKLARIRAHRRLSLLLPFLTAICVFLVWQR